MPEFIFEHKRPVCLLTRISTPRRSEFDVLRTDAEKYAQRLVEVGTTVVVKRFPNCVHGFTHRAYRDEPQQAIQMMIDFLEICFKRHRYLNSSEYEFGLKKVHRYNMTERLCF